jgi:acyl-coenzyme A thioesterase 13
MNEKNERVELISKMIGIDPQFWPYPIPKNLNLQLLEVQEGSTKMKTIVQKDWLNPLHILHGGIMVTLMDEVMGICAYTLKNGQRYATINLNADFLASAKENEVIYIFGKIEKTGRQLIHAISRIENEQGRILAKSSSNLLSFTPKSV